MIGNNKRLYRTKWLLGSVVFLFVANTVVPPVYCQTGATDQMTGSTQPGGSGGAGINPAEAAGVDELVRILIANGLLKPEQAEAMMAKKGEPGFSALAALTELLKSGGLITSEQATNVMKKAEDASTAITLRYERDRKDFERMTEEAATEIKRDVRQTVKAEVKEEVLQETKKEILASAAPEWTKRIRFGGDVRVRYNGDYLNKNNGYYVKWDEPSKAQNTTEDRNRLLVRARLGATAEINEYAQAGVRLTTGSTTNPVSTNQTMGTYFNNYTVVFDRAYIKAKPLPSLTVWGGRFENPFFHTDMVWDPDISFDGAALSHRKKWTEIFSTFATVGAFPLQEIELSSKDKWLYAGQVGIEVNPGKRVAGKIGVAYYDYRNIRGIQNLDANQPDLTDYSAFSCNQKGNTPLNIHGWATSMSDVKLGLADEYKELNITAALDLGFWDPVRISILGDYVKNLGFDAARVNRRYNPSPKIKDQTDGYQIGLSVGHVAPSRFGEWKAFAYYRYLEADAVVAAFTDSDFHLGGTDAKGWILGGEFGLMKNVWAGVKWVTTNQIAGPPLAIDSLYVDVNWRF